MTPDNVVRDIRDAARRAAVVNDGADSAPLSQDALALDLGEQWKDSARYVAAWGRWTFYRDDAGVWRMDETLEHMTRARAFLRDVADSLGPEFDGPAKALRKADTVAKVVSLARSNPAQVATVGQWDADPWVLGTPGGVVDLRTGELRPSRPDDYITKSTAVAPAPEGTPTPLWSAFLDRITDGDRALQTYKQRLAGYALTGTIREHVFAFGHGTGANGKGVELNTYNAIWGDYALTIPTEMLMVSNTDRHPTELARLRGVRLAIGSETEQGKRWAEARIKSLTGGDPVAARFMRQDYFEFEPQFKLYVVGNHRPSLRGVDEAMRRRLHLVPYTVTIPEGERDPELSDRLEAEWPAILRWAIDGCLAWQREGLNPPAIVRAATDEYLEGEDAVALWLEDSADLDPNAWEPAGSLFASWKRWTDRTGEFAGTQKRFGHVLQERGFEQKRGTGGIRGYRGIRLQPNDFQRYEP
jgi:putative DNA primase/helicase